MTIGQQVTYRTHPSMSAPEARIVEKLVDDLLAAGLNLSVYDGEEWPLRNSTDKDAIWAALASTDRDEIVVSNPKNEQGLWPRLGWIILIWGNDQDVISDYSISLGEDDGGPNYIGGANKLAEQLLVEGY